MKRVTNLYFVIIISTVSCGPGGNPQSGNSSSTGPGAAISDSITYSELPQVLSPEDQKLKEANIPFSMLGRGPRHLHRADLPGPKNIPVDSVGFKCGARVFASPVIGPDGTIYVGSIDGTFNAIRMDGRLRWSYVCGEPIFSTAAVSAMGTVYVGCDNDSLLAFSSDGTSRFSYTMKQDVDSSPVISKDGTIYVGGDGLHMLTPGGKRIAKVWLGGHVSASPSVRPDGTVIVGSHDHRLYAVLPEGTVDWSFDTAGPIESPAAILDDNDTVFGSDDGYVYRLSIMGNVRWKFQTDGPVKAGIAVAKDEKTLYIASMDGAVYGLNASTGKKLWMFKTASNVRASPILDSNGTLFIGSEDSHLYAINSVDGTLIWRLHLGAEIDSTPAITTERRLIVGSDDGVIHILKEAK